MQTPEIPVPVNPLPTAVLAAMPDAPWWALMIWSLALMLFTAGPVVLRIVLDYRLASTLGSKSLDKVDYKGSIAEVVDLVGAIRPVSRLKQPLPHVTRRSRPERRYRRR